MRHDLLSDVLSAIKSGDTVGKTETITPASKLIKDVLLIMQKHNFVGNFEHIEDKKGGKFRVQLIGNVNNCRSIRPRFAAKVDEFEKYERRFLPSVGVGLIVVSTAKGIMTHLEAKEKKLGGRLLAYVY
jgi:small subunit ribosomal protein S8